MTFLAFKRLYNEAIAATDYSDPDMYIAERGWQPWMDACKDTEEIICSLNLIADLTKMNLTQIREEMGLSRAEMSRKYEIPLRTLENWEAGTREPLLYVKYSLYYNAFMSLLENENEGDS